jgi:hypothetical protein
MHRIHLMSLLVALSAVGCSCNNFAPVDDCNGVPCPDAGGGGSAGTGGGTAGGMAAGGDAGGSAAGGDAGGMAAGGMAAGGNAGGTAGGDAGGSAGGMVAGGTAGGMVAGGAAGGATSSDGGVFDFCAEIAQRECDFYIRCVASGSVVGDAVTGRPNNTVPTMQRTQCEAERRTECRIQQAGATRGRRATNLTALRACLDAAFPSASCARDRNAELTLCDEAAFTTPLGRPGAICTSDLECAQGFCQGAGGNQPCGACRSWVNPDGGTAVCNETEECAAGTYCRQGVGPDVCVPLVGADGGCTSSAQCAPGLVCPSVGGIGATRTCQTGKPEGASCVKGRFECFRSSPTDFDLLCSTTPGVTDGGADRCARRFNTMPGGFCNTSEGGGNTGVPGGPNCLDTEYCNAGLCEPRRAVGQPCGTNNDVCALGSRCFGSVCTAYGDVGAACANNDGCKAMLYCAAGMAGMMGTCQPFVSFQSGMCGGYAGFMSQTEVFPYCRNASYCPTAGGMQVCQAQKAIGQACASPVECLGGSCNGMCVNACWN